MTAAAGTLEAMSPAKTKTNPLGAGRNPRADKPATHRVTIRLTPAEAKTYEAAAASEGITLAEWFRAAAVARARKAKR